MRKTKDQLSNVPFKTFPKFSKLTLNDKNAYEEMVADYPPFADLSFAGLMIWWNYLGEMAVAKLNDNLVISYWLPGMEKHSGLSLIGNNELEASICAIFDYQISRGEAPRLVHVPEFVVSSLQHSSLFAFSDERDFDEYVIAADTLYPLSGVTDYRKKRIEKFAYDIGEENIALKQMDLNKNENVLLLKRLADSLPREGVNNVVQWGADAVALSVEHAQELGIQNLCLFVNDELWGFCLFQLPRDKRYAIINHVRVRYEHARTFDYFSYAVVKWLVEHKGISLLNIDMDLGLPMLRGLKLSLEPVNYFRKYTIRPSKLMSID